MFIKISALDFAQFVQGIKANLGKAGAFLNFPFKQTVHLNYEETILPMRDGLPKLKDFPAAIGGSGETMPE
jgi:hypothetical protein